MTTLVLEPTKIEIDDERNYSNFYFSAKTETIVNDSGIDGVFDSIYSILIYQMYKNILLGHAFYF